VNGSRGTVKQAYAAPKLVCYGEVARLTRTLKDYSGSDGYSLELDPNGPPIVLGPYSK
jgi:hypothetical protein